MKKTIDRAAAADEAVKTETAANKDLRFYDSSESWESHVKAQCCVNVMTTPGRRAFKS